MHLKQQKQPPLSGSSGAFGRSLERPLTHGVKL